jgi:metal-responsive CopG/Arc/MetJ family transcriptional regulator
VKTAISIPDALFEEADRLATQLGKSRSEFIADALREHLQRHGDAAITAQLNAVYARKNVAIEDQEALDAVASELAKNNPW